MVSRQQYGLCTHCMQSSNHFRGFGPQRGGQGNYADAARALCRQNERLPLLPQPREPEPEPPEPQTGAEHVAVMIENLMDRIIGDEPPLTREARLEKIRFMDSKGIFLMKGSIEKASEKLGVNKVTIYSYLDEVRGKRG